jgi:hypothetical protein
MLKRRIEDRRTEQRKERRKERRGGLIDWERENKQFKNIIRIFITNR